MFLYGATLFLSAFLLFLIQPLIGKHILPWFGGTPAVWTTCMMFFQALLLGGYGYAHALVNQWSPRRQALVHLSLLGISVIIILWFSILPSPAWKPTGDQAPILRILGLMSVSIGAPYLLLSATSPLLQSWFSRMRPDSSPYRLYALSNLGSLIAIISYPFLIEPAMRVSIQAKVWTWVYVAFALLCIFLSRKVSVTPAGSTSAGDVPDSEAGNPERKPGLGQHILWLSLSTCGSVMLLATTSQLCLDVAVIPLLWILPLALYLLSFIFCFQHERLYWRPLFLGGMAVSIAWTCYVLHGGVFVALAWQITSYSLTLFLCCMVCHGELVRLRPKARHLTSFYLMVAVGGVLGGLLVSVAAPSLMNNYWEYHYGLLAVAFLALVVLFLDRKGPLYQGSTTAVGVIWGAIWTAWIVLALLLADRIWLSWRFYAGLAGIVLLTIALLAHDLRGRRICGRPVRVWAVWGLLAMSWIGLSVTLGSHVQKVMESSVKAARNFFGVVRVLELNQEDPEEHRYTLMHGRIEHGFQFRDQLKSNWPTSYYGRDSGIGLAIGQHPRRLQGDPLRIGVVGLGTGTLAAYGEPGDTIRFYEINPLVLRISDEYFTYRKDSRAHIEMVLGDARISMEKERQEGASQQLDLLAVDAFSSDAIPVHLLTRECFEIYRYHLKQDGIMAIHISNRYFDLSPIVRNLAANAVGQALEALWIDARGNDIQGTDSTDWILITANRSFLENPRIKEMVSPWEEAAPPSRIWTDDYSDLYHLLRKKK
jgi:hypothetical protein